MKSVALVPVFLAVVLTACGSSETPAAPEAADLTKAKAADPEPDQRSRVAVPWDQYSPVANVSQGGTTEQFFDLVALNGAMSQVDPAIAVNYDTLANMSSRDYFKTKDAFAKKEMLDSLQAKLKERMEHFKRSPYVATVYEYKNNIEGYDFNRGGFPLNVFKGYNTLYAGDTGFGNMGQTVQLELKNEDAASVFVVADQELAKRIEAMRTGGQTPSVKAFFAAEPKPTNSNNSEYQHYLSAALPVTVVRMQMLGQDGKVLAEYTPGDGDTAPSHNETPANAASIANGI